MPYNPPTYPSFIEARRLPARRRICSPGRSTCRRRRRSASPGLRPGSPQRHGLRVRTVDLQRLRPRPGDPAGDLPRRLGRQLGLRAADRRRDPAAGRRSASRSSIRSWCCSSRCAAGRSRCSVALPDVNQVLKRMNGRLFPFGIVHFLRRRRIIDQARLLLLGVLPEVRRIGLYPLLMAESYRRGRGARLSPRRIVVDARRQRRRERRHRGDRRPAVEDLSAV